MASPESITKFIDHWSKVETSEKATAQQFILELCDLLVVGKQFTRAKEPDVQEILDTLCALGRVRPGDTNDTYVR